jgi:hypothetical protein
MSYIGRTPQIGAYHKLDSITCDGSTAYTMQLDSANFVPESVNHLIVSVNGVIQAPTDSFTVSSSTITFASALSSSDTIDFIMALGNVLDIGTPSDATVSLSKLTATGTKDATTFLRGDNTFATPSGGTNTPAFATRMSANQNFTANADTKAVFDTEDFDTDSAYDTSNYRFTVPSGKAGKYLFTLALGIEDGNPGAVVSLNFRVNGSELGFSTFNRIQRDSGVMSFSATSLIDLSESDYVEVYFRHESGATEVFTTINTTEFKSRFSGYKLIGA